MFQIKKVFNNSSQEDTIIGSDGKVEINMEKMDIGSIPVRTMKNDLANMQKDGVESVSFKVPLEPPKARPSKVSSEKQKSSPFLTQEDRETPIAKPSVKLSDKELGFSEKKSGINWGRFLMTAIIILIIAISGLGSYYFWITRMNGQLPVGLSLSFLNFGSSNDPKSPDVSTIPPVVPSVDPIANPPKELSFSLTNPNLAVFDPTVLSADSFREFFLSKSQVISNESITSPVEFLLVDGKNNPISFQDFVKKVGLGFRPSLLANLGENYSLFLYNDNGSQRLGIVIDLKNEAVLKKNMVTEEVFLASELEPLFLVSQYELEKNPFTTSEYNGIVVRYLNISSPENLSIDYTFNNSKLVIGTTKMTLRKILDKLSSANSLESDSGLSPVSDSNSVPASN